MNYRLSNCKSILRINALKILTILKVQDSWQVIGSTGYSARTLAITRGTHSIYHINPTVGLYVMMYGQVIYESYGFPAGK